jgi:[acyl-carrier-protein] S-malonyltransferase
MGWCGEHPPAGGSACRAACPCAGGGECAPQMPAPAVLFPGQGSQAPGMRDLVARYTPELLDRCLELVGEDPFARVEESTRFAQPAIFCASWAGWTALGVDTPATASAGHSLGEVGALAAAGVFDGETALELVVLRGRLMAEADDSGSMLALLGGEPADAHAIADAAGVTVANDNAVGQVVLSADRDKLARAEEVALERGVRARPLDVAAAFHSPAMAPAVAPFRAALDAVELREPRFPVYSCASAQPFTDIREELAQALTRPVRWRETFTALHAAGNERFIEVGPGRVLAKLARRIVRGVTVESLPEEVAHA